MKKNEIIKGTKIIHISPLCLLIILLTASCAPEINPYSYAPPAKEYEWTPDDETGKYFPEKSDLATISDELTPYRDKLVLTQLIDVALQNSPQTEKAWAEARAAAAAWAVSRGSLYPTIDGAASAKRSKFDASSGLISFEQTTAELALSLDYLLLDFGGRIAEIEEAKQALVSANWTQNKAIQDVVLNVSSAYYELIGKKSDVKADIENLQEAQTSLDAANLRLEVGLGTLPDVLQAQSSLAQAELNLVNDQGQVEIARGDLATSVGWGANEGFEIQEVDENFEPALLTENVDNLIIIAMNSRPDLAATLALVRQSEAAIKSARSAMLPSLSTSGTLSQLYVWSGDSFFEGDAEANTNYQFGLTLAVPIFHGFALRNAVRQAEAELEAARATLKIQEQEVVSDVWDAYYNFQTSVQALAAAKKLLASSLESYNASLERYRSGVGDIIELLTAQSTLANSRSETVQARTNIFVSYAQLVNAVGLNLPVSADGQTVEIPEFNKNNSNVKEENNEKTE